MILSYLRLAWKALFQKRLYTLVSLFGITFTLSILFVGASLYDYMLKPNYPEFKQDRVLVLDEIIVNAATNGGSWYSSGGLSYSLIRKCILPMKTPELISVSYKYGERLVYQNKQKLSFTITETDASYWKIFDFKCIEGKLYGEAEINSEEKIAVISESTARKYFGSSESAVGKNIKIGEASYLSYVVTGVVKDVPEVRPVTHGDIWLPLAQTKNISIDFFGKYTTYLLAPSKSDLGIIRKELDNNLKKIEIQDYPDFGKELKNINIQPFANTHAEKFFLKNFRTGRKLTPNGYSEKIIITESEFYLILILVVILLMAFPAINLINIHVSRYMERSSEIGIRRSYGAKKRIILGQLLAENLVITALGSLLAIVVSFVVLHLVEASDLMQGARFSFNFRILVWGIAFTLLFNLLSGIVPAWKISRLHIIQSLKGGEQ